MFVWSENGPKLLIRETFTSCSFDHKMACHFLNFGNKLRMMGGIGKEYGLTLTFDMLRLFTLRKTEYQRKMANIQSDC